MSAKATIASSQASAIKQRPTCQGSRPSARWDSLDRRLSSLDPDAKQIHTMVRDASRKVRDTLGSRGPMKWIRHRSLGASTVTWLSMALLWLPPACATAIDVEDAQAVTGVRAGPYWGSCENGLCARCIVDGVDSPCDAVRLRLSCHPAAFSCDGSQRQLFSCTDGFEPSVATAVFVHERPDVDSIAVVEHISHGLACCEPLRTTSHPIDLISADLRSYGYTWLFQCLPFREGDHGIRVLNRTSRDVFLSSVTYNSVDGAEVLMW